jgi:PadR family transcriptional regulator, regulatory protein AphA
MPRDESTSFALLGLLSIEPMSGYDMRRHLKDSMSYFWSESYGQIYPALKRLTAEGLIQPMAVKATGKRERQVYRIAPKGRANLKQWLGLLPRTLQPRDEFLLKLFLGSSAPEGAIANHIRVHKAEQEKSLATYQIIRDFVRRERSSYPDQKYWLLLLSRAMALRQTEIGWCDEALALLGQNVRKTKAARRAVRI